MFRNAPKLCIVFCHMGFLQSYCSLDTSKEQSGVYLSNYHNFEVTFQYSKLKFRLLTTHFQGSTITNTHFKGKIRALGKLEIHARALKLKLWLPHSRSFGPFDTHSIRFNSKFGSKGFDSSAKVKWQGCGTKTLQAPTYGGLKTQLN